MKTRNQRSAVLNSLLLSDVVRRMLTVLKSVTVVHCFTLCFSLVVRRKRDALFLPYVLFVLYSVQLQLFSLFVFIFLVVRAVTSRPYVVAVFFL